MPTGKATDADLELIEQLASNGVTVSARQLQDWRRKGIISGPEVARRGRRGTESVGYPDSALFEVARVYYLLQEGSSMAEVVVSLFGVGVTPIEKELRNACTKILDQWEAKGRIGLILSEEPGTAYARRVRRFTDSIGKGDPEMLARWEKNSQERAREESEQFDYATGRRLRVSKKDIQERDTAGFLEALVEGGGDPYPILESWGLPSEVAEVFEDSGGWPTFGELRSALDATSYIELTECRDEMRAYMRSEEIPFFPEAFAQAVRVDMDDPSKIGLYVGLGLLFPLAIALRENGEEAPELGGQRDVM